MQIVTFLELTKILKMNKDSIRKLIKSGEFPKPLNMGTKKLRWLLSDVEIWIKGLNN